MNYDNLGNILHISYDFGDYNSTDKTTAVSNLIRETKRFADVNIISLNRVISYKKEYIKVLDKGVLKVNSFGLPFGILHKKNLNRAYNKILKAETEGLVPISEMNLIHSHKLTFEGYIGYLLSKKLSIPLFLTLRQTDFDVLRYRPDLRELYRKILQHSTRIFYLVPIMLELLVERFGIDFFERILRDKLVYLPNIVEIRKVSGLTDVKQNAPLITILRITRRSVKRKNLKNLIKAAGELKERSFQLHIIGGGDYTIEVQKWIDKYKVSDKIKLIGTVPHDEIDEYYASAKGFVLPSFSESFGLVYAEALLNGTPILYSKGVIGFDGVFENVGPAVDPHSVSSIRDGLIEILDKNDFFRDNIKELNDNDEFKIFSGDHAAKVYYNTLTGISLDSEKIKS